MTAPRSDFSLYASDPSGTKADDPRDVGASGGRGPDQCLGSGPDMSDSSLSSPYGQRGFAAVPRGLRDHPAFKALNAEQRLVVLTLYMVARWGEGEYRLPGGTIVKVPAASYFGSTRGLADECRVDYQVVFRLIRNPLFSELWEVQTVFFDPEARNRGESKPKQPTPDGDAKSKQAPKQAGTLFTMRYGKDIFLYAARGAETAPETDPKQPSGEDRNRSETAPKHKDTREQENTDLAPPTPSRGGEAAGQGSLFPPPIPDMTDHAVPDPDEPKVPKRRYKANHQPIVDAWAEAFNRPGTARLYNAATAKALDARMAEGWTADRLIAAVRGMALVQWRHGDPGKNNLSVLLRPNNVQAGVEFHDDPDLAAEKNRKDGYEVPDEDHAPYGLPRGTTPAEVAQYEAWRAGDANPPQCAIDAGLIPGMGPMADNRFPLEVSDVPY